MYVHQPNDWCLQTLWPDPGAVSMNLEHTKLKWCTFKGHAAKIKAENKVYV